MYYLAYEWGFNYSIFFLEFFMELDEECGCLSLHSPFSALVHYVRKGLYKLKDGT